MDARITPAAEDPPSDSSYPPTSGAGGETSATGAKTKDRKGREKRVGPLLVAVNGGKGRKGQGRAIKRGRKEKRTNFREIIGVTQKIKKTKDAQ